VKVLPELVAIEWGTQPVLRQLVGTAADATIGKPIDVQHCARFSRNAGRARKGMEALAAEEDRSLSLPEALANLTRKGVRKEVVEKVKTMYEQTLPVEAVPQEPGAWRFANVLSLLAHGAKGDAAKDLQEAAFEVVVPGGRVAA
jgi:hypothetical protein